MNTIPRRVEPSARPDPRTPARIRREFQKRLDDGARLHAAGTARRSPARLLDLGYAPKFRIALFDTVFYLSSIRQNPDLRFFIAWVAHGRDVYARLFYKDVSLVWRSASHFVRSDRENWIGKGEVRTVYEGDDELTHSAEETTDLPLEMQTALEELSRRAKRVPADERALGLVLRRGPDSRIAPYRDFTEPRRRAQANPRNRIHRDRPICRFTRRNDPASLVFARGFEPDLRAGIVERAHSNSRLYGGALSRYRILSSNRRVQYLFFAGPHHIWIIPPQATTTELSSYGVRTIDVPHADDLCVPGYEYHFMDDFEDPPVLFTQIPPGFAGPPSELDPSRADTSKWLDQLPIVREFRRVVLGG